MISRNITELIYYKHKIIIQLGVSTLQESMSTICEQVLSVRAYYLLIIYSTLIYLLFDYNESFFLIIYMKHEKLVNQSTIAARHGKNFIFSPSTLRL